jgi:F-type H+-transporting ATPase subunit delta
MRVSAKQYATALYEATAGKGRDDAKKAVLNFINLLVNNNGQTKLKAIIDAYAEIYNQREGVVEAEITSARELGREAEKALENYLGKKVGAKKTITKKSVDPALLGGAIIRFRDRIIDASIKAKISALKEDIIK